MGHTNSTHVGCFQIVFHQQTKKKFNSCKVAKCKSCITIDGKTRFTCIYTKSQIYMISYLFLSLLEIWIH